MAIVAIIIVTAVIIGGLIAYSQIDPEGFAKLFPESLPDVAFLVTPNPRESDIKLGTTTFIPVEVRNMELNDTIENVYAKLSVIDGENWEEHLEFNESTKLADKITPGDLSERKNITIQAIKLSGANTPFEMRIEIMVDGVSVKKHDFDIKIVP